VRAGGLIVPAGEAEAIHIGPHPLTVGGTQSVIRTIGEWGIGAEKIAISPSWAGPNQVANLGLMRRTVGAIVRARRGAVAHVHLSSGGAYLRDGPMIALARARGLRVVVTIHGFDFPEFAAQHRRLVRAALAPANGILCLSDETLEAVHALDIGARARKLPNPIPIDSKAPTALETEPIVLFAGAIGIRKGVDVLQDAWRLLLERGIEGRCRIVGPVEDYQPQPMERLSVEDAVDPRRVRPLIRDARVVTLPSRAEGMPMILTEALAAGRPFVSTPVGGTPTLAPCEGMIVPVGNSGALADAIERFLTDPAAAADVGGRCREFCRRTRGPEVIGAELREFYRAL
jgi:glycosyltransferase involved in cell wall biosynthesis